MTKPKLTIRETHIIQYEVVDENGELMNDNQGNTLFDTREEAEQVVCQAEEDKVWKERYDKLTVHCLKCDDIFRETEPPAKVCPNCGNTDKNKTVYLQGEQDEQNQLRLHDLL